MIPTSFTGDTCDFFFTAKSHLQLYPERSTLKENEILDTIVGGKGRFRVDPNNWNNIKLEDSALWFPEKVFPTIFGTALRIDPNADLICDILMNQCNGIVEYDQSLTECRERLMDESQFPATEGGYNAIDGKSFGCRVFHASLAAVNENHCPHISFDKMKDINGKEKCQTTRGIAPSE